MHQKLHSPKVRQFEKGTLWGQKGRSVVKGLINLYVLQMRY
jgi:hypothetical protein